MNGPTQKLTQVAVQNKEALVSEQVQPAVQTAASASIDAFDLAPEDLVISKPPEGWSAVRGEDPLNKWGLKPYASVFEKRLGGRGTPSYDLTILVEGDKFLAAHGGVVMPDRLDTVEAAIGVAMAWYQENVEPNADPSLAYYNRVNRALASLPQRLRADQVPPVIPGVAWRAIGGHYEDSSPYPHNRKIALPEGSVLFDRTRSDTHYQTSWDSQILDRRAAAAHIEGVPLAEFPPEPLTRYLRFDDDEPDSDDDFNQQEFQAAQARALRERDELGDCEKADDHYIPGCGPDDTRDSRGQKLLPRVNDAGEPRGYM